MAGGTITTERDTPAAVRFSTSQQSFRFKLREATSESHAKLDNIFGRLDLRRADDYRSFLIANAMAVLPLEAALARAGVTQVIPDWASRSRSAALKADLAQLGASVDPKPLSLNLSHAGILGVVYVLEGSRLGARVITNRIASSQDPLVLAAQRFLSHGASEPFWQTFVATLESEIQTPADQASAIAAAKGAFDLFAQSADAGMAAHEGV